MNTVDNQPRERIRDILRTDPTQVQVLGDTAKLVRDEAVAALPPKALETLCFDFGIDQIRRDLLNDKGCELEALAVDQVISQYIQIGTATHHAKSCIGDESRNDEREYWERRSSLAQTRLIRSMEILTR